MRDITAIIGLLLLSAGCSWAYPPLGLIVSGGILLAAAVLGHLREGATKPVEAPSQPGETPPPGLY
jgi:hypothetical protein